MNKNSKKKKWCCSGLEKAFNDRNKNDYQKIEGTQNQIFNIATRKPVHSCPWCGINLGSTYPSFPNALTDKEIEKEFK